MKKLIFALLFLLLTVPACSHEFVDTLFTKAGIVNITDKVARSHGVSPGVFYGSFGPQDIVTITLKVTDACSTIEGCSIVDNWKFSDTDSACCAIMYNFRMIAVCIKQNLIMVWVLGE